MYRSGRQQRRCHLANFEVIGWQTIIIAMWTSITAATSGRTAIIMTVFICEESYCFPVGETPAVVMQRAGRNYIVRMGYETFFNSLSRQALALQAVKFVH